MLCYENKIVVAELDVRWHGNGSHAYDAEQSLDEAVVVGHQEHDLVVSADAQPAERGRNLLRARFQFGVGQGNFALFDDYFVRVK